MSRPFLELNTALIEELAGLACTVDEIARICKCSKDTLERNYMENLELGRANMRLSIRRKQYQVAMDDEHKGQTSMLIWLGKIICDQWEVKSFLSKLPDDLLKSEIEKREHERATEAKPTLPAIDVSERVKAIRGEK